jgi:hypothetical protein
MTTAETIFNSMRQAINETVIDEMVGFGLDHQDAVKIVVDSDDFDIVQSGLENPVSNF